MTEMSAAAQCASAKAIRQRLRRPANAVIDLGIDLHRPPTPKPPPGPREPMILPVTRLVAADAKLTKLLTAKPVAPLKPQPLHRKRQQQALIDQVAAIVTDYYGLSIEDVKGSCRDAKLVKARQIICSLCRELLRAAYPAMARVMEYRDHTSVFYGVRVIAARLLLDPLCAAEVEQLRVRIKSEMRLV